MDQDSLCRTAFYILVESEQDNRFLGGLFLPVDLQYSHHPLGESIAAEEEVVKSRSISTPVDKDPSMIDHIEFTARHLTSNAGLLLLLENTHLSGQ